MSDKKELVGILEIEPDEEYEDFISINETLIKDFLWDYWGDNVKLTIERIENK